LGVPGWKVHRRFGRLFGFDERLMKDIDKMLDYPEFYGVRLGHKSLHNLTGVMAAYVQYGEKGAGYAALHIYLDNVISSRVAKILELLA
jgi:hypothetical protein